MNTSTGYDVNRLLLPDNLMEQRVANKFIIDAAFYIIGKLRGAKIETELDRDAQLLFQMTVLKSISLLTLSEGLQYENQIDKTSIHGIIDCFSMNSIVRSQFEAFCNFNNIYIQPKNVNERTLKYDLWALSGLKHRQNFRTEEEENKRKKEDEKLQIESIIKSIENNPCFSQLNEDSKIEIRKKGIKDKDWKLKIIQDRAFFIAWHDLMKNANITDTVDGIYRHLSLTTHPSNVSVFQFNNLYNSGEYIKTCLMSLQISNYFISFLITDYCHYSSEAKKIFHELPYICKYLINSLNCMFRGNDFVIYPAN